MQFYEHLQKQGKLTPLLDWQQYASAEAIWYLNMFRFLERSRGPNEYIPLSEIVSCFGHFDLIGTKQEFITVISALDEAYIAYFKRKSK